MESLGEQEDGPQPGSSDSVDKKFRLVSVIERAYASHIAPLPPLNLSQAGGEEWREKCEAYRLIVGEGRERHKVVFYVDRPPKNFF